MYTKIKTYLRLRMLKDKLNDKERLQKLSDSYSKYVLIIDQIIPAFREDSGSRRLTEIIKMLQKNNVGVVLLGDLKEYRFRSKYISDFKEKGVYVYEPCLDESGNLVTKELFLKSIISQIDIVWLHRPEIFQKYEPLIRKLSSRTKVVYDMVDFHYLRFMREFELTGDKTVLKKANKYLKMELDSCEKADKIIVISEQDKNAVAEYYKSGNSKTVVIGNVHQSMDNTHFLPFSERKDLLFIGGFFHSPNVDCVQYLHDEIMPLVWEVLPEVSIQIIGSNATESILALNSERFKIIGYAESVDSYFLNSRLFVAPLRYGAGIKGKIGQSLEFSLPLVTTTVGAEGFDFGKFRNEMVADSSQALAERIVALYQNETLWNQISDYASEIISPFSNEAIEARILSLID